MPAYRREFFERLIARLKIDRIECYVIAGRPLGEQAERSDAVEAPWIRHVKPRTMRLGGRRINLGGSAKEWRNADAVVVGLIGSSVDTYSAVLAGIRGKVRVGLWGHVSSYTSKPNKIDLALERWQMHMAHQIFSYTPGGSSAALAAGISPGKITTLMNSVDTDSLKAAAAETTDDQVSDYMIQHGLSSGRVVSCLGGLDATKRIDFLVQALDELFAIAPDIKVLVAGEGHQSELLEPATTRGQVIRLGFVGDAEKALLGRTSSAFLNPGRIGLVAVEALLLQVPIITTPWAFHAPEAEYLTEGVSRLSTPDSPKEYAHFVRNFCDQSQVPHQNLWEYPTLDEMVENFRAGVLTMLNRAP